eukprot:3658769-Prymnesium_polylepis.1
MVSWLSKLVSDIGARPLREKDRSLSLRGLAPSVDVVGNRTRTHLDVPLRSYVHNYTFRLRHIPTYALSET